MESIINHDKEHCFICGCRAEETHHIFGGANRNNSEKYGLKVRLCHHCHNEPPYGAHFNTETDMELKRMGQIMFERTYPEEDFREIFGKNYR